jgi:hypothetical protein
MLARLIFGHLGLFITSHCEQKPLKRLSFSNWSLTGGFPLQVPASLSNYYLLTAILVGGFLPNAAINLIHTVTGFDS